MALTKPMADAQRASQVAQAQNIKRPALSDRILSRLDQCISIAQDLDRTQASIISRLFGEEASGAADEHADPVESFESIVIHRLGILRDVLTSANSNAQRLADDL